MRIEYDNDGRGVAGRRRWRKMTGPPCGASWVWFTREMIESPSWRALTLAARRVIDRVIVEHLAHGGAQNGELVVTYDNFEASGVRRRSIPEALAIGIGLGWIDRTGRGGLAYGIAKRASTYGLTWLPRCDRTPASNRWKGVATTEAAAKIIADIVDGRRRRDRQAKEGPPNRAAA